MKHALLHTAVRTALFAALALALNACSGCGAEPTDPNVNGPPDSEWEIWCGDTLVSSEKLVVDFREDLTREAVESFAIRHAFIVADTVPGANSYILSIDRSLVPSFVDAVFAAHHLRTTYPDTVLFAEAKILAYAQNDYVRFESLYSTERIWVEFYETSSPHVVDSLASEYDLAIFSVESAPLYVRRLAELLPAERTVFYQVDRSRVHFSLLASCICYHIFSTSRQIVKYAVPIERHYRTIILRSFPDVSSTE